MDTFGQEKSYAIGHQAFTRPSHFSQSARSVAPGFRFDNRKNPYLFRDTLLKLLEAEHPEYKELIAV
jgi:hypothetical protein